MVQFTVNVDYMDKYIEDPSLGNELSQYVIKEIQELVKSEAFKPINIDTPPGNAEQILDSAREAYLSTFNQGLREISCWRWKKINAVLLNAAERPLYSIEAAIKSMSIISVDYGSRYVWFNAASVEINHFLTESLGPGSYFSPGTFGGTEGFSKLRLELEYVDLGVILSGDDQYSELDKLIEASVRLANKFIEGNVILGNFTGDYKSCPAVISPKIITRFLSQCLVDYVLIKHVVETKLSCEQ